MTVRRALCLAALAVLLAAAISGRAVFAEHCAVCHSISGQLSRVQQGGDLRGLRLPRSELVEFTVEMPVIHRRLRPREVQAVVDYMRSMARRR
ncbi:MAG TPA: cytochrome c [Solirubrobacteraceae bacterium]|nr:cytochrome c [Solirubrobacteraceae bacterium]